MLAPLDNEVVFKKAFTERDVLIGLVKDIIGIDFNPGKIETEKEFLKNPGNVEQKYDIYAESVDHRVVVELQRVEYDYHFDRFLYYHNMAIAEFQENCNKYKIDKTVYTIVFLTRGYKKKLAKNGEPIKDSVLISDVNPKSLKGKIYNVYGHKLIFLNSFYKNDDVPQKYKDWLKLVDESINNQEDYNVNENKKAIKKVCSLIDYKNISSSERREMKVAEEKKDLQKIEREEMLEEREEMLEEIDEIKTKMEEEKRKAEIAGRNAEEEREKNKLLLKEIELLRANNAKKNNDVKI